MLWLDHLIFGNGCGLGSPYSDGVFYWLGGRKGTLYTFGFGFGAQLKSFQWFHPKPGERRVLCQREFTVFGSNRRWCRVEVSWAMRLPKDLDDQIAAIRDLKRDLRP